MNLKNLQHENNQNSDFKIIVLLLKFLIIKMINFLKLKPIHLIHFLEGFENEFKRVRYN